MYNTIIFDLDLTLLDTLDDLCATMNYVLRSNGFKERTKEEINSFIGNGIKMLIKRAMPSDVSNEIYLKGIEQFRKYYSEHLMDYTKIYDGIIDVLKVLKKDGFKLCVASNKDYYAVKMLCDHFFKDLLDVIIGTRSDINSKPSTDMIEYIKKEIPDASILYIGDSEVDCQTAINAKVDGLMVSWGSRGKEVLASFGFNVIDKPSDLIKYIKNDHFTCKQN